MRERVRGFSAPRQSRYRVTVVAKTPRYRLVTVLGSGDRRGAAL